MKIKKVEVQAFRAYLEKANGTFDFMVPDQDGVETPANFISLYAPNGFGKSSFYDAVEWAMTNGSERFSAGVYEAAARGSKLENEALRILRNTEAPEDLETLVTVSTTVKEFKRRPGTIRRDSFDVDFKRKKLAEGSEAYQHIFLSQDAIDHFIRGIDPESRYKTFVEVYGEETELLRREVQSAYLGVGEQIEKYKGVEKKLANEIDAPVDNSIVNKFLGVADELSRAGLQLKALPGSVHDANLDELTEELITTGSKIQFELEALAAKELALNELVEGLISNNDDTVELSRQLAAEQVLLGALGEIGSRDAVLQSQVEYEAEIVNFVEELRRNESVIAVCESYRLLRDKKLKLEEEVDAETLKLKTFELRLKHLTLQRNALEKNLDDIQQRKATWDLLRTGSGAMFDNIGKAERDQLALDAELKSVTANVYKLATKSTEQLDLLSVINQMPEDNYELSIKDFALLGLDVDLHSELRSATAENLIIEGRIASINLLIIDLESQSNAFGRLAAVAGEILTSHPGRNCPLCQADHGSPEALKVAIDSNEKLKGLLKEKSDQRNSELDKLSKSKKQLSDINENISAQRLQVTKKLEVETRTSADELLFEERKKASVEARLESLKQGLISSKAIVLNLTPDELSAKVDHELKGFSSKIDNCLADLGKIDNEVESVGLMKLSAISILSENNTQLATIHADQNYVLVRTYLENHSLDSSCSSQDLAGLNEKIKDRLDKLRASSLEASSAVILVNEKLANANIPVEPLLVKSDLDLCTARISELRGRVESYSSKFATVVGVSPTSHPDYEEKLSAAIKEALESIGKVSCSAEKLGELRALLDPIKPIVSREIAKREMELASKRRNEFELLREKIGAELKVVNEALERQLDTVFQTDLINEIYRKIDPHPSFGQVKFSCGFGLKNKPTLNVVVKEKGSEKEISPLLYFSSAQLNILSLSIFLARALNAKSPTGQPLDLILIDDPIHSMDSINVLSTIDLLRGIAINHDKQIVISTHDENFYELLKRKVPAGLCKSKFLRLKSFGRVEVDD